MLKNLAGYFFISLSSFCFFTGIFHAVAHAQVSTDNLAFQAPIPKKETFHPTPTMFTHQPQVLAAQTSQSPQPPSPTPTVYTPQPTQKPFIQNFVTKTPTPNPTTALVATPIPTAVPTPQPVTTGATDLESLFTKYSDEYHIDREQLKKIARCESGFNSQSDTGTYAGMYQFAAGTWSTNRNAMGLDANTELRKNPEESIKTAAFMLSRGQQNAWPNCH